MSCGACALLAKKSRFNLHSTKVIERWLLYVVLATNRIILLLSQHGKNIKLTVSATEGQQKQNREHIYHEEGMSMVDYAIIKKITYLCLCVRVYVCLQVHTHGNTHICAPLCMCEGQRTICRIHFSPSTLWVSIIQIRPSG